MSENIEQEQEPPGTLTSPLYGTATFSSLLSPTTGPRHERTSSGGSSNTYAEQEDESFDESAEVEAALNAVEEQLTYDDGIDDYPYPNQPSSEYASSTASGSRSFSGSGSGSMGTLSSMVSPEPYNLERRRQILSTITERTEDVPSTRPGSNIYNTILGSRPLTMFSTAAASGADLIRRSLYERAPSSPSSDSMSASTGTRSRSGTPEGTRRPAPPSGRRAGDLIAFFEEQSASSPTHTRTTSAPTGARSPSPFTLSGGTYSASMPALTGHTRTGTGTGLGMSTSMPTIESTYSAISRPSSPSKSTRSVTFTSTATPAPVRPTSADRSGGSSPQHGASNGGGEGEGFFSLRRRADRGMRRAAAASAERSGSEPPPYEESASVSIAPSFDITELGPYARGSQEPLRVGLLWYLNVHSAAPYRWQRTHAVLYPNTLILSWIAPGGGRGIVTLDLMNCNEVRSVPSPSHVSARDDIGTVAARMQAGEGEEGGGGLVEMLCPFQLLYDDGIERLGSESARERVRWVGAIWEALDRSVTLPDRSQTRSPTQSVRTIGSIASSQSSNKSGSGSASTVFVPPLDTLEAIPDFESTNGSTHSSSRTARSSTLSATELTRTFGTRTRTRATDDAAISSSGYYLQPSLVLGEGTREITPSRSSSLRRTSSLEDLSAEFASAMSGLSGTRPTETRSLRSQTSTTSSTSRDGGRTYLTPSRLSQVSSSGERDGEETFISPRTSGISGSTTSITGITRRVQASTFYSLTGSSSPLGSPIRSPLRSGLGLGSGSGVGSGGTGSGSGTSVYTTVSSTQSLTATRDFSTLRSPETETGTRTVTAGVTELMSAFSPRRSTVTTSVVGESRAGSIVGSESGRSGGESERGSGDGSSETGYVSATGYESTTGYGPTTTGFTTTGLTTTGTGYGYGTSTTPSGTPTPTTPTRSVLSPTSAITSGSARPTTPTRTSITSPSLTASTARSPESSSTASGLSRSREVRRRTPRRSRTTSHTGSGTGATPSESDKENEDTASYSYSYGTPSRRVSSSGTQDSEKTPSERTQSEKTPSERSDVRSEERGAEDATPSRSSRSWSACNTDEWTSLNSRSYTSSSTYSEETRTRSSLSETPQPSETEYLTPSQGTSFFTSISPALTPAHTPVHTPTPTLSSYTTPSSGPSSSSSSSGHESVRKPPSSTYVTAELCPSESSYETAECRCIPSEVDEEEERVPTPTPSIIFLPKEREREPDELSLHAPSIVPTIPDDLMEIANIPLPPSTVSTVSLVSTTSERDLGPIRLPSAFRPSVVSSPTTPSTESSVPSTPVPPTPVPLPTPSLLSSISSTTTPTISTWTTMTTESESESSRAPPSMWAQDTDYSYDSSILQPTPSVHSIALPEAVDASFDTSFLRPSMTDTFDRGELMTPISSSAESTSTPTETSTAPESSITVITLERTPSTLTTSSSASLRSDIFETMSLMPFPSPSTVPSLLPTLPTTPSVVPRVLSPSQIPLPDSTAPSTPGPPSISVSMSTPRTAIPSIHSLESDGVPIDPIMQTLNNLGRALTDDNRELKDKLRDLEDELRNLNDALRGRSDRPPPVPLKDRSAGGSTHMSDPYGLREGPSVRSLTPPRMIPSPTVPSSISDSMSFLSSHHSDDFSLMSLEEYPPAMEQSGSPVSTATSWTSTSGSSDATTPPPSFTPPTLSASPASTVTPLTAQRAGPSPTEALGNLRDLLETIRGDVGALWQGQIATNHMLDELRDRHPIVPDNSEIVNRLHGIEDLLNTLLRGDMLPRAGVPPSEVLSGSTDTSSAVKQFLDRLRDRRPPEMHDLRDISAPTPTRPQSFDADWADFLRAPPPAPELPVQGPPPLVPLIRRTPRIPRAISVSPPISPPPRSYSVPLSTLYGDEPRQPRRRAGERQRFGRVSTGPESYTYGNIGRAQPPPRPSQADIDMERAVRDGRAARRPTQPGGFFDATTRPSGPPAPPPAPPPRVSTAPPGPAPQTWYYRRRPRDDETYGDLHPPMVPPPGFFSPGPSAAPQPGVPFVPMMPMPAPVGIPAPFNEMLELLRQNRLAQTASIDQQREIMRYMRGLNEWLEHDVRDRQDEIRSIGARVDALRDDLSRMGIGRTGVPGAQGQTSAYIIPPVPQGGTFVGPGGPVIPPPFVPTGFTPLQPVIPGVMPSRSRRGSGPFIPPHPDGFPHDGRPVIPFADHPHRTDSPGYLDQFDEGRHSPSPEIFVPPMPPGGAMQPGGPGPYPAPGQIIIQAPSRSRRSGSGSRSRSRSRSSSPRTQHVVHHDAAGPPTIVRVDSDGRPITGTSYPQTGIPIHPSAASHVGVPLQQYDPSMPHHATHSHRSEHPIIVGRSGSRSRSRTPPPAVIVQSSSRRHRHSRSPSQHVPVVLGDGGSSRSRSYSPRRQPPVVVTTRSRRTRSRSPTQVVVQGDHSRSRSRSHSPRVIMTGGSRRSRSRSPRVLVTGRDRSRSRSPAQIVMTGSRRRSRSPTQVIVGDHSRRSRSRSPAHVILGDHSRRSRSHSPTRVIVGDGSRRRSRSRSPVYIGGSRRHSRSPDRDRPVVIRTGSRRSRSPIILGDEGGHRVLTRSRRGSVSPPVIVRSRHGGSQRTARFESPRRSRSPVYDDAGRRSRSHSPRRDGDGSRRSRRRSPTLVRLPHSRRGSRSLSYEGDSPTRRRRRRRDYSGDSDEYRRHRGDHYSRRSPSYRDGDAGDRRRDRRSPSYRDGDGGSPRHRRDRRSPPYYEGDARDRSPTSRRHRSPPIVEGEVGDRYSSPSRPIVVRTRRSGEPTIVPFEPESTRVTRTPTAPGHRYSPHEDDEVGRPPTVVPFGSPSRGHEALPHIRRYSPTLEGDAPDDRPALPITPSRRAASPRTDLEGPLRDAPDGEHLIPIAPSDGRPLPIRPERFESDRPEAHEIGGPYAGSERPYADGDGRYRDGDRPRVGRERYRVGSRAGSPGSLATVPRVHRLPSGPGDLGLQEAEQARQMQFDEAQQQWHDAARHADEAEELRERYFRDHEDERDKIFQDNENRRDNEATQRRDEIYRTLGDRLGLPGEPTGVLEGEPGVGVPLGEEGVAYDEGGVVEGSPVVSGGTAPSAASGGRRPPSQQQYDELRDLLLECRDAMNAEREVAAGERAKLMELADAERIRAQEDCEGRIATLEAELARAREELDQERNQRRNEELERMERDHNEAIERDEAMRQQLTDMTDLVSAQREEHENQKALAEQRLADKEARRGDKDSRTNALFDMMQQLVRDREAEKEEREAERAAAAERPGIDQVIEEMRQRFDDQAKLINELSDTWREESAKQVADLMEHIKTSTAQMADFNITGYLDEFSKALAGEIRQLLTEVGSLHSQKRGLQFELGELQRMLAFYGPGGQFEPDWMPPAHGPLAHQPPPPDLGPPPPPDAPPPPAKPAWRSVHQRQPRKKKGKDQPPPPQDTLDIPGAPPQRHASWSTWQPNPNFAPTPPEIDTTSHLVPPTPPQGLFGPRSQRSSLYDRG